MEFLSINIQGGEMFKNKIHWQAVNCGLNIFCFRYFNLAYLLKIVNAFWMEKKAENQSQAYQ